MKMASDASSIKGRVVASAQRIALSTRTTGSLQFEGNGCESSRWAVLAQKAGTEADDSHVVVEVEPNCLVNLLEVVLPSKNSTRSKNWPPGWIRLCLVGWLRLPTKFWATYTD